jgi:hypothetical protein
MPDGVVMPQLPEVHVVFTTLQLGQLVEVLPAAQAVVAELLEELAVLLVTLLAAAELDALLLEAELVAVLVATELLALELEAELATALLADEALLELATELLAATEDLLLELAAELEVLLLDAVEAALDEVLAVRGIEHSLTPPATRAPNVVWVQAKLPLSVA